MEVIPLIKNGKSIGVIGRGRKLELYSMYHLENDKSPDPISCENSTTLFTNHEFDVVFFTMYLLSVEKISRRLTISPHAVKKNLASIYEKAGVSTMAQLAEYCRNKGYDKYTPYKFISPNLYIPLSDYASEHSLVTPELVD